MQGIVTQPLVLFFLPALPCSQCGRQTHYSEIDNGVAGLLPRCWEHGLIEFTPLGDKPTQYALQEQYASVARFVLGHYEGFGQATVIGKIATSDVPGYVPPTLEKMERFKTWFEGNEDAWQVRYTDEDEISTCFVIWSYDENEFRLVESEA